MLTFVEFVEILVNEQMETPFLIGGKTFYIRKNAKGKLEYASMEAVLARSDDAWRSVDEVLENPATTSDLKDVLWLAINKHEQAERNKSRMPTFLGQKGFGQFSMSLR